MVKPFIQAADFTSLFNTCAVSAHSEAGLIDSLVARAFNRLAFGYPLLYTQALYISFIKFKLWSVVHAFQPLLTAGGLCDLSTNAGTRLGAAPSIMWHITRDRRWSEGGWARRSCPALDVLPCFRPQTAEVQTRRKRSTLYHLPRCMRKWTLKIQQIALISTWSVGHATQLHYSLANIWPQRTTSLLISVWAHFSSHSISPPISLQRRDHR